MKTIFTLMFAGFLCTQTALGQSFKTDEAAQENIQKLDFLVGNWEGAGWSMGQDGIKRSFNQSEKVQFKIDSTAILFEGKGINDGKVVHNALAIVTSNTETGNYDFHSYLQNGMKGNFKAELKDDKFFWYPNEDVRYIISINEKGHWHETGEVNREGEWMQFFEMTLTKV